MTQGMIIFVIMCTLRKGLINANSSAFCDKKGHNFKLTRSKCPCWDPESKPQRNVMSILKENIKKSCGLHFDDYICTLMSLVSISVPVCLFFYQIFESGTI